MTNFKQIFIVRTDLKMGKGKIAAQCSHAAVDAYEKALRENPKWVEEWKHYRAGETTGRHHQQQDKQSRHAQPRRIAAFQSDGQIYRQGG